jgi:hypothetical protein
MIELLGFLFRSLIGRQYFKRQLFFIALQLPDARLYFEEESFVLNNASNACERGFGFPLAVFNFKNFLI